MIEGLDMAQAAEGLEFEDDLESDQLPEISSDRRAIRTKSADPEIESLHGKWKRGRLILQPEFQRQYVWDKMKASRLIESALLSVPLPIVYVAEESDGCESVIDGQQRLSSFFRYIDGVWEDGPFKLSSLRVFKELNGKTFKDLPENLQDKIRYCEIRTITLLKDSEPELKFEIFERLNTGSMALNEMELRNCVYRGPYLAGLKELAQEPDFLSILGLKGPDKRMKDVALVLRFAAFFHATYLRYQPPMRRFFNSDMEHYSSCTAAELGELRSAFKKSLQLVRSIFGEHAFKRFYPGNESNPNGYWEQRKFNASLFDVWMGVLADVDKNRAYACLDSLREAFMDLMTTNSRFIEAIQLSTSAQEQVRTRFDLARQAVDMVLRDYPAQPRLFSRRLKQELFDRDSTCSICGQAISFLDDAHVDHVKQYWTGGQTIPENARLTHRYCNMARSRND